MAETSTLPVLSSRTTSPSSGAPAGAAVSGTNTRRRRRLGGESPPSSRAGMSVVAFAEHPDRLLCDPHNALWLYAVFEYRYGVSPEDTQAQLLRLLRKIERIAAHHYEASVKMFQSLPVNIQHFQILRATPAGMAATMLTPSTQFFKPQPPPGTQPASSSTNPFGASAGSTPRHSRIRLGGSPGCGSRDGAPAANRRPSVAKNLLSSSSFNPAAGGAGTAAAGGSGRAQLIDDLDPGIEEATEELNLGSGEAPLRAPQPLRLPEDQAVRLLAQQWPPLEGRSELEEQLIQLRKHAADQQQQQSALAMGPASKLSVLHFPSPSTAGVSQTHESGGNTALAVPGAFESHTIMSDFAEMNNRHSSAGIGSNHRGVPFPAARPKIKVVLDIVASRKMLGLTPSESQPYKLGQWAYQYYAINAPGVVGGKRSSGATTAAALSAMTSGGPAFAQHHSGPNSPRSARSTSPGSKRPSLASLSAAAMPSTSYTTSPACCQVFVGISDSGVKMVGRDFLFPFKVPPGGVAPAGTPGSPQRLPTSTPPVQLLLASLGATQVPSQLLPSIAPARHTSASQGTGAGNTNTNTASAATAAARLMRSSSSSGFSHHSSSGADAANTTSSPTKQGGGPQANTAGSNSSETVLFCPSGELPVCIRQPPIHLENIDQRRFIVKSRAIGHQRLERAIDDPVIVIEYHALSYPPGNKMLTLEEGRGTYFHHFSFVLYKIELQLVFISLQTISFYLTFVSFIHKHTGHNYCTSNNIKLKNWEEKKRIIIEPTSSRFSFSIESMQTTPIARRSKHLLKIWRSLHSRTLPLLGVSPLSQAPCALCSARCYLSLTDLAKAFESLSESTSNAGGKIEHYTTGAPRPERSLSRGGAVEGDVQSGRHNKHLKENAAPRSSTNSKMQWREDEAREYQPSLRSSHPHHHPSKSCYRASGVSEVGSDTSSALPQQSRGAGRIARKGLLGRVPEAYALNLRHTYAVRVLSGQGCHTDKRPENGTPPRPSSLLTQQLENACIPDARASFQIERRFHSEIEDKLRQLDYASLLLCVLEVVSRWCFVELQAGTEDNQQLTGEMRELNACMAPYSLDSMRSLLSDRILESVLTALAKMPDLCTIEEELNDWMTSTKSSGAEEESTSETLFHDQQANLLPNNMCLSAVGKLYKPLLVLFEKEHLRGLDSTSSKEEGGVGTLFIRATLWATLSWLAQRAPFFSASVSARLLQLLAQQPYFSSTTVLATLVDTIRRCCQTGSCPPVASAAEGCPETRPPASGPSTRDSHASSPVLTGLLTKVASVKKSRNTLSPCSGSTPTMAGTPFVKGGDADHWEDTATVLSSPSFYAAFLDTMLRAQHLVEHTASPSSDASLHSPPYLQHSSAGSPFTSANDTLTQKTKFGNPTEILSWSDALKPSAGAWSFDPTPSTEEQSRIGISETSTGERPRYRSEKEMDRVRMPAMKSLSHQRAAEKAEAGGSLQNLRDRNIEKSLGGADPSTSSPLLERPLYDAVIKCLTCQIVQSGKNRGSTGNHSGDKARETQGFTLLDIPPTTFFFLVRSITKLNLYTGATRAFVAEALLPGTPAYLDQHPEQYLSILFLLGRRENGVSSVPAWRAILKHLRERVRQSCLLKLKQAKQSHVEVCSDSRDANEPNPHLSIPASRNNGVDTSETEIDLHTLFLSEGEDVLTDEPHPQHLGSSRNEPLSLTCKQGQPSLRTLSNSTTQPLPLTSTSQQRSKANPAVHGEASEAHSISANTETVVRLLSSAPIPQEDSHDAVPLFGVFSVHLLPNVLRAMSHVNRLVLPLCHEEPTASSSAVEDKLSSSHAGKQTSTKEEVKRERAHRSSTDDSLGPLHNNLGHTSDSVSPVGSSKLAVDVHETILLLFSDVYTSLQHHLIQRTARGKTSSARETNVNDLIVLHQEAPATSSISSESYTSLPCSNHWSLVRASPLLVLLLQAHRLVVIAEQHRRTTYPGSSLTREIITFLCGAAATHELGGNRQEIGASLMSPREETSVPLALKDPGTVPPHLYFSVSRKDHDKAALLCRTVQQLLFQLLLRCEEMVPQATIRSLCPAVPSNDPPPSQRTASEDKGAKRKLWATTNADSSTSGPSRWWDHALVVELALLWTQLLPFFLLSHRTPSSSLTVQHLLKKKRTAKSPSQEVKLPKEFPYIALTGSSLHQVHSLVEELMSLGLLRADSKAIALGDPSEEKLGTSPGAPATNVMITDAEKIMLKKNHSDKDGAVLTYQRYGMQDNVWRSRSPVVASAVRILEAIPGSAAAVAPNPVSTQKESQGEAHECAETESTDLAGRVSERDFNTKITCACLQTGNGVYDPFFVSSLLIRFPPLLTEKAFRPLRLEKA
eukprot:gene1434-830_t